jgi:hypothetical protein
MRGSRTVIGRLSGNWKGFRRRFREAPGERQLRRALAPDEHSGQRGAKATTARV